MENKHKEIALNLFEDFIKSPQVLNQGVKQSYKDFDKERQETLVKVKILLEDFLEGKLKLDEFKTKVDSLNKKSPYWGFRGINGQMFFNMLFRNSENRDKLNEILKKCLKVPSNINEAAVKINDLIDYIKHLPTSADKRKTPKIKSVLFFLSYFWQIQEPLKYPVFYTSLEQTLTELNFLQQTSELSVYYTDFFEINNDILKIFLEKEKTANLWFVEHVFWNYYIKKQEVIETPIKKVIEAKVGGKVETINEFIPPIISDLVSLSLNESNPVDFEKKTALLFKMLGFDVEIMGQGKGRTVDIICRANLSKPYIILVDCKARSKKDFKLDATEERKVEEYIRNFPREYPKDRQTEMHYLIVSSGFKNGNEESRRNIKGITGTDISFISIEDLLFLFVKKLQDCYLDAEEMRDIFQREGLISKDIIQDAIGR